MSARETIMSRRLLLAGGAALGARRADRARVRRRRSKRSPICFRRRRCCRRSGRSGSRRARAISRRPASRSSFAVGRGGVDVAKQVGAGNAPLGGIVADGPIMVRGNGVPVKIVAVFGGKGFMQLVVREDSRHREAGRPQGQDHHRDVLSGHHVLCAARPDGERRADAERRQHPAVGPTGVWQFVADRQVARHGRRAGLDSAGAGRGREGAR